MTVPRGPWWATVALTVTSLTVSLDTTVLTVALPTLENQLGATKSDLQWFSAAYTLSLALTLLPAGLLADRFGRRTFLAGGLVLFGTASGVCAMVTTPAALIAVRAVLGLSAAFVVSLSVAVIPTLFPRPADRERAIALMTAGNALGLPLGPVVGGFLLDHYGWGSVFLLNTPLAAVAAIGTLIWVPPDRERSSRPIDGPGLAFSAAGLISLTYGLVSVGGDSRMPVTGLVWTLAGVVLLGIFVKLQLRRRDSLIDRAMLRPGQFRTAMGLSALVNFVLFGVLFVLPQYAQAVSRASAWETGLLLLPMLAGLIAGTRITRLLAPRVRTVTALGCGFAVLSAGLALGATTGMRSPLWFLVCWTSIHGIGLGMTMPTTLALAVGGLPASQAGMGSALLQAVRQTGGAIGVAVLGAVFNATYHAMLPKVVDAFVAAMDVMLACGAAVGALAFIACLRIRNSVPMVKSSSR